MCTETKRVGDYVDVIYKVQSQVTPIFSLLRYSAEVKDATCMLTNEELAGLGWLLDDMFSQAFDAAEAIYEIYKQERRGRDGKLFF